MLGEFMYHCSPGFYSIVFHFVLFHFLSMGGMSVIMRNVDFPVSVQQGR